MNILDVIIYNSFAFTQIYDSFPQIYDSFPQVVSYKALQILGYLMYLWRTRVLLYSAVLL